MGYFLWLNDSIITINVAKAIANINDSNTDIGTTPFRTGVSPYGSEPTTLERPILLCFDYTICRLLIYLVIYSIPFGIACLEKCCFLLAECSLAGGLSCLSNLK